MAIRSRSVMGVSVSVVMFKPHLNKATCCFYIILAYRLSTIKQKKKPKKGIKEKIMEMSSSSVLKAVNIRQEKRKPVLSMWAYAHQMHQCWCWEVNPQRQLYIY